jgi:MoxR-like ATPase
MTPPGAAPLRAEDNAHARAVAALEASVASVIRGKDAVIRQAVTCLLARGHLLIEDIPGVGKTTLARALAASVGGSFRRVQFTSDLLPSDIVGVSVFRADRHEFEFRKGPIFANVVLADEINRTTPRTQSALLEAMSEGQVSVDDVSYPLEQPFLVIATQNPTEHYGTYPLPESQLDRFLLRIGIGYPDPRDERAILRERTAADPIAAIVPAIDHATLAALQDAVLEVKLDDRLLDYAMAIVGETRRHAGLLAGISTRGALGWYRAAQAHALVGGRGFCVPDDLKALAVPALAHRVTLAGGRELGRAREEAERVIADIVGRLPVPT